MTCRNAVRSISQRISMSAREKRPERWRDIWSAGHSTSGVTGVLSVDELVARTIAEYRAADARSPVSPV
jgi:nitronate monooxygenase